MQVHTLSRDRLMKTVSERADRLRSTELSDPGSAAARNVVLGEAARMQQIAGDDTLAMKAEIERLRASSRSGSRTGLGVGLGFVAASGVTALALSGMPGIIAPMACAGAAAMAFMMSYGGFHNDKFYAETGQMIDRWSQVATAPPAKPGQWLQTLPAADPKSPPSKAEVQNLMEASRSYLTANLDQPGHAEALSAVERDIAGLARRPETDLSVLRSNMADEAQELRNKMQWVGYGAVCGMAGGVAGMFLVGWPAIAIGFGGSATLATVGQLMLRHERKELELSRHLGGWEKQLKQLKEISADVHALNEPGQSAGIRKQAGYLLVGGVRVPVASTTSS